MLPFPNRLQLLIPLIIFGFIVFQLDLLFRFQHGAEVLDQSQPTGFTFLPPITSNLPSKNAIITLLSGPQLHDEKAYAFDKYCEEALYQAYSFLHSPATKLGPDSETEFVVMMTPGQTSQCRSALLELGARVIVVPILSMTELDYSHRYHYTYTKYQMWALEGIYEKILYIDLDLLFVTKSPIPLFSFIDQFHASTICQQKRISFMEEWKIGTPNF
ncbi:hypothetical protein BCR33DRAFT_735294 [Rhizoclosmatium globosum]|uniref:Nucleotide-diphospho-sugar transferase n=1 Tax=Rhizoclosmatium globosum TaxID=329046 RepID=A0A1Y2CQP5_9FUNG|nr:hypothetical protein BCR33DRAFT_735294 [Rhizoclosmatium globosum]|eukprot:ORY49154.1 hypothetical protein BCR33DRAFT_735294 [Rhizoclosmatium globosum]